MLTITTYNKPNADYTTTSVALNCRALPLLLPSPRCSVLFAPLRRGPLALAPCSLSPFIALFLSLFLSVSFCMAVAAAVRCSPPFVPSFVPSFDGCTRVRMQCQCQCGSERVPVVQTPTTDRRLPTADERTLTDDDQDSCSILPLFQSSFPQQNTSSTLGTAEKD